MLGTSRPVADADASGRDRDGRAGASDPAQPVRAAGLAALAAAVALVHAAPGPATLLADLTGPRHAADPTAPLVALLALLAWVCACHLLLVAALTLGGRLPGVLGTVLDGAARRLAPPALRRALAVALGVGVAIGATGGPAAAAPLPVASATQPAPTSVPGPLVPSLGHPVAAPPPAAPATQPPVRPARAVVVVQPGDCLWSLAQAHLGPGATDADVAQEWPAWWAANRDAVGEDPDLIRPGTRLVPPPAR